MITVGKAVSGSEISRGEQLVGSGAVSAITSGAMKGIGAALVRTLSAVEPTVKTIKC